MDKPVITWYARMGEDQFQADMSFYAGTYTKAARLSVDIQVWNNRWGVQDAQDLPNAVINFYFDSLEDSARRGQIAACFTCALRATSDDLITAGQLQAYWARSAG